MDARASHELAVLPCASTAEGTAGALVAVSCAAIEVAAMSAERRWKPTSENAHAHAENAEDALPTAVALADEPAAVPASHCATPALAALRVCLPAAPNKNAEAGSVKERVQMAERAASAATTASCACCAPRPASPLDPPEAFAAACRAYANKCPAMSG